MKTLESLIATNPDYAKVLLLSSDWLYANYRKCIDRFNDKAEAQIYANRYEQTCNGNIEQHTNYLDQLGLSG